MRAKRNAPSAAMRIAVLNDGRPLRQIAKKAGLPASSVIRFVNGNRNLSGRSFDRVADALGLELRLVRRSA